jgi:hypothetical protein
VTQTPNVLGTSVQPADYSGLDPEFKALVPGSPAASGPDLSQISTADLKALQTGDLSKVSTAGLKTLQSFSARAPDARPSLDPDFAALSAHVRPGDVMASGSNLTDWLKSAGSSFVRPVAKAVGALPLMAMDAGVASRNIIGDAYHKATGQPATPDYELPSSMYNSALDQLTQAPTTGLGKAAEFASTALIGGRVLPQPTAGFATPAAFAAPQAASGLSAAQQQTLNAGRGLGMQVTPGQGTISKALQQLEAKLESQPWTSGPFNALKTQNQTVLNRQAAAAIGEDAPALDSTVLGRANERLGSVFENVRSPDRVLLPDPEATTQRLNQIDSDLEGLLPNGQTIRSNPLVQRLEDLSQSGSINGEQLGQLSSKLGKAAYKQMASPSGDRDLGQGLYKVKDHVDDLLQGALSPDEAATYAQARQQYRNLMLLTSRSGIVNPSSGNVSGNALASRLQQADRSGYLFGKNQSDLYNAARFSQAFKPVVGDSGTATRSLNLADIASIPLGLPLNLASRAYLSGPGRAVVRGAMSTPGLLGPMVRPAMTGGLLAGYTQ